MVSISIPMRTEQEIFKLITDFADTNERIRAALLNGSRANPNAIKDKYQDFDILFLVKDIKSFIREPGWINVFGERLILQMPDDMTPEMGEAKRVSFSYLMLFTDGNRIDLTLFPAEKLTTDFKRESLTRVLIDKDKLFSNMPPPDESDYYVSKPNAKEYADCCNEFWWVATYVAKGLARREITCAKEMLDIPVRKMFFRMISWYIGIQNNFSVSFGKAGKNMERYVSPDLYTRILSTWSDAGIENTWTALFRMTEIFSGLAQQVAQALQFNYSSDEDSHVRVYLQRLYKECDVD